jgi:hypothetical protein
MSQHARAAALMAVLGAMLGSEPWPEGVDPNEPVPPDEPEPAPTPPRPDPAVAAAAARIRAERAARKAANFAKRQPKGSP